jgi:carotenoid cleavage dioxygenase-like enzyme
VSLLDRFYLDGPERAAGDVRTISGAIPPDLRGTVLRNGPGRFRVGADVLPFFDAHGMVAGRAFHEGQSWWRAARIQTPVAREEGAAGRMTRRRVLANLPGGWARNAFKLDVGAGNGANHDVFAWRGKIFATADPGIFSLDLALDTIGKVALDPGAPAGSGISPMPWVDPATGHLVGYTQHPGGLRPDKLSFFELALDGTVKRTPLVPLGAAPVLVHGHAFSASWYAVVEIPARLSLLPAVLGTQTIYQSLRWSDASSVLVVVPRAGGGRGARVELPGAKVIFHLFDAWDDGDVLELVAAVYADIPPLDAVAPPEMGRVGSGAVPKLVRYRVDPRQGRLISQEPIGELAAEAGCIDGRFRARKHHLLFAPTPCGSTAPLDGFVGYFHGIARIDLRSGEASVWSAGEGTFVSPPTFAPRGPEEGDGWLIAWTLTEGGTGAVILDARDVAAGPVAELALDVALPGASHVRWEQDVLVAAP